MNLPRKNARASEKVMSTMRNNTIKTNVIVRTVNILTVFSTADRRKYSLFRDMYFFSCSTSCAMVSMLLSLLNIVLCFVAEPAALAAGTATVEVSD